MSRVAIVGAGNLGAFLAAHLTAAGHDVFFCVRRPPPPIRIAGLAPVEIPFHVTKPLPEADLVILTVKAHDTPSAMIWLDQLCNRDQPVAVVQNGVHHARRVAPYPAIPVLSYVYIEAQDGVYRAFEPPRPHFTVPAHASSEPFAELFRGTPVRVLLEPEFHTASWRKMLHNCVSNPLTALAGRGLEILCEPVYREWAGRILGEAISVAQADGADVAANEAENILNILASYPPGTRTSMLQDREQGKRLEIDALNGAIVALGREYRIATPVNLDLVTRLGAGR